MRFLYVFILLFAFSSCCKYMITPATIDFRFEGFDPAMNHVTVVSLYRGHISDTLFMSLDGNKKGTFKLNPFYQSDSIYLKVLLPAGVISLRSLATNTKNIGSGCGGPADEGQVSFIYKDSTYTMSRYHFVVIRP